MFTKQTPLLERLRGIPYADQLIDALTATYHNCANYLFHRAPVQIDVDGAKEDVPDRLPTAIVNQQWAALNVRNHSSYYDLSADTIKNGTAETVAGVVTIQPSNYVQSNASAFKSGVENNVVLVLANGGAAMLPNILGATFYDSDGTSAATVSGSTFSFQTILVAVAIGAQANRVPQVWFNNINAQAQPAVQMWVNAIGDAVAPVVNLHVNTINIYVTLIIVSSSATAFVVSQDGTNYILQVDCSTANADTGIKITGKAAGAGAEISVNSSSANDNLSINAKAAGTITLGDNSTGDIILDNATTLNSTLTGGASSNITINTSAFTVNATTGNTSVGGTLHSGGNFDVGTTFFTVEAATGNTVVGGTLEVTGGTTLSSALTYGGVTLANAVTGTGNMMLSDSPTTTGTLTGAAANFSGAIAYGTLTGLTFTFISSIQYDTATNKIQYKTTTVTNGSVGAESGSWTDLTAGGTMTTQSVVTDVVYTAATGVLKQTKSTLTVFEKTSDGDSTIDTAEAC